MIYNFSTERESDLPPTAVGQNKMTLFFEDSQLPRQHIHPYTLTH